MRARLCVAFTLLEVLLALGLFVVATGILSGTLYSGLQAYRAATGDSQIENRYRLVLRQVLQIADRTEFERGGSMRLPDGSTADWEATLNENSVLLDLFEVNIHVRLNGDLSSFSSVRDQQRERDFKLQLYRTDWADIADRAQLLDDRRRVLEDQRKAR